MKLSIISITYNNLQGLKKTLALFESNNYSNQIEIIVIDGGSKDETKAYLASNKNVNTWVSESDNGIYNAMNKGLLKAKGNYIWFLNAGDYVESSRTIDIILETLESGVDAIYGETMMVDSDGIPLGTRTQLSTRALPKTLHWKSLRYGMNVSHQSFIIKRNLAPLFDESLKYVSDIDWMIKCLKECKTTKNLEANISNFTLDGFSSINRHHSNKERYLVLKKHYGLIPNAFAHIVILFRKLFSKSKI